MSDLKGTINYFRALRDICNKYPCMDCPLFFKACPYQYPPVSWTDSHILSMITYAELTKKEGE